MGRIVYYMFSAGTVAGGLKMIARHVETLRDLGFDATCVMSAKDRRPGWFDYGGPLAFGAPAAPDDILVIPEDAPPALRSTRAAPNRVVVLSQNPYGLANHLGVVGELATTRPLTVIAVAPKLAAFWTRLFPAARVELVPCFADERRFRPAAKRGRRVVFAPRKRQSEAVIIRRFFDHLQPGRADLEWLALSDIHETEIARAFGEASLHLALARLESVGMTTLEAMAAGCVCAGFLGVGGYEFATRANGFWVPDDDCQAAADALALADDLVRTGGPALAERLDAGRATAAQWSYARFRGQLEEVWMRLAPEMRLRAGPLDA